MSSPLHRTPHVAGLPPGWSICYPASQASVPPNAPSFQILPPPPTPTPATSRPENIHPTSLLTLPPHEYVSLSRNYETNQKIYPYLRNPYDQPFPPRNTLQARPSRTSPSPDMSNISTWRADPPGTHTAHHTSPYIPTPPPAHPPYLSTPPSAPPYEAITRHGSPFVVKHICQYCQQPRSIKYHAKHQLPYAGNGPLLSTCRKCTKVESQQLLHYRPSTIARSQRTLSPRQALAQRQAEVQSTAESIAQRALSVQKEAQLMPLPSSVPTQSSAVAPPPKLSRRDIRQIAREEIRSYRNAERRIEQHHRPFAYGEMVPCDNYQTGLQATVGAQSVPTSFASSRPNSTVQSGPAAERRSNTVVWMGKYDDYPPERPRSPPEAERVWEQRRSYRESISPHRKRIVEERVIMNRPSPDPGNSYRRHRSPGRGAPRRDDRGRTRQREEDEKPTARLRSILRSPSASPWESDRSGPDGRRVSFSNAIDVSVLSPPPTASNFSSAVDDAYRQYDNDRRLPEEKYYYERTRRPDPDPTPRRPNDRESVPVDKRALTRAFSESPSRERGLQMVRGDSPGPRRHGQPRKPCEYSPPPASDRTIFAAQDRPQRPRPDDRERRQRRQDPIDGYGPYRPTETPSSSMRGYQSDSRSSLMMSGALPSDQDRHPFEPSTPRPRDRDTQRPLAARSYGPTLDSGPPPPRASNGPQKSATGDSLGSKRQVLVDSGGKQKLANILSEGRDKYGRWIEVEEAIDEPGR